MTTTTLTHLPGFLDDVLYQAEWRASKAAEYPDDERNQNAADHLKALHAWLRHGATEHLLLALDMTLGRLYAAPDVLTSFQPGVTDRLGRLGFSRTPGILKTPMAFYTEMMNLINAINEHLEPEPEPIEDRIRAAAADYVEKIKALEEEYLEERDLGEDAFAGLDEEDAVELSERKKAEQINFYAVVKEAEADSGRGRS